MATWETQDVEQDVGSPHWVRQQAQQEDEYSAPVPPSRLCELFLVRNEKFAPAEFQPPERGSMSITQLHS